jgi:hypothetical protein
MSWIHNPDVALDAVPRMLELRVLTLIQQPSNECQLRFNSMESCIWGLLSEMQ